MASSIGVKGGQNFADHLVYKSIAERGLLAFGGIGAPHSSIPWQASQEQGHATGPCEAGKEQTQTNEQGQDGKTNVHGESQGGPYGADEPDYDLHLSHEGDYLAGAAFHGQAGIDPALRAACHEDATAKAGGAEFFDRARRAGPGLANYIEWLCRRGPLLQEIGRTEIVEREESCAGHMCDGEFRRGAHVEEIAWCAALSELLKLER